MKTKPVTPYQRLRLATLKLLGEVQHPARKLVWYYEKDRLGEGWSLVHLDQRVRAADALGYDVHLVGTERGLEVNYVKRVEDLDCTI